MCKVREISVTQAVYDQYSAILTDLFNQANAIKTKVNTPSKNDDTVGISDHDFDAYQRQAHSVSNEYIALREKMNRLIIVNDAKIKEDVINLNDCFTVRYDEDDEENYHLVLASFSSLDKDGYTQLSVDCPLGSVLINAEVGSKVSYTIGSNHFEVTIVRKN